MAVFAFSAVSVVSSDCKERAREKIFLTEYTEFLPQNARITPR